jgi:dephospho-CoA kinase
MIIIGITGTSGAGKGTVVKYLQEKFGLIHFSAREFIIKKVLENGLPVNRDTIRQTANGLRENHSPEYIIEQLLKAAMATQKSSIIESVRNLGEVAYLRSQDVPFYLFSVDALPEVRYERVRQRQSETDFVSLKKFLEQEKLELSSSDLNHQNLLGCMAASDYKFDNSGSIEDLQKQIDEVMEKISYY